MSEAAHNLINAFKAMPIPERHEVLLELARISEHEAGSISDEELAYAGEQVFEMYDDEESESDKAGPR